jgi:hypothetical protein
MSEERLGGEATLTPYEWLLFQLYPHQFLGCDLFAEAISAFISTIDEQAVVNSNDYDYLRRGTRVIRAKMRTSPHWSIFIDEAQELLRRGKL